MAQGMTLKYDEHADVLYISLGKPSPAVSEEVTEGVLMRRDPKTKRLVGVTILDFRTSFLKSPKPLPFTLEPA